MPDLYLVTAIAVAACAYASVGHAGASAYLALLALWGLAPEAIRPAALILNIAVAVIATVRFTVAGHLRWRILVPCLVTSLPAAWLGGRINLPTWAFLLLLGICLLWAAGRLAWPTRPLDPATSPPERIPLGIALIAGAIIGFISGLIGIGGGILLSPLLMLGGWASARTAAATSAAFILLNSVAGLAGRLPMTPTLPPDLAW